MGPVDAKWHERKKLESTGHESTLPIRQSHFTDRHHLIFAVI
jgi:hypothetical protein